MRADEVDHLGDGVDVRHGHVALRVGVRVARVVHALERRRGVLDDAGDLHAAALEALPAPIAADSDAPNEPAASCRTTSLRRYGWPSAPRVVWALARFSAVTSIRRRSAVRPDAEISRPPKRLIRRARAHRGLQDPDAGVGDLDGGLLLERVLGELGGLGLDVDRRAVGAGGAGRGVLGRGEGEALQRAVRASSPLPTAAASAVWKSTSTRW